LCPQNDYLPPLIHAEGRAAGIERKRRPLVVQPESWLFSLKEAGGQR
jgi:hypothetical protein